MPDDAELSLGIVSPTATAPIEGLKPQLTLPTDDSDSEGRGDDGLGLFDEAAVDSASSGAEDLLNSVVTLPSDLAAEYRAAAHGGRRTQFQRLSALEEEALCGIVGMAGEMDVDELCAAVAESLGVSPSDPAVQRVVANLNAFLGGDAAGVGNSLAEAQASVPDAHSDSELDF
jgi:hypothetical protein